MTNAQIIMNEAFKLMEAGIIKGSGIFGTIQDENGDEKKIELPESIHTYAKWKELGYQVQKGQKAIAKFTIWKHTTKKAKTEEESDESKMFMKTASFFTMNQCQKIS